MSTGSHPGPSPLPTAALPAWRGFTPGGLAAFTGLGVALALPVLLGPSGASMAPIAVAATVVLGSALVLLSAIDFETRRLPDVLTLPLLVLGLAFAIALDQGVPGWRIASAAIGYLALWGVGRAYLALRGRPGLGLGDAKLMAAGGAWLGVEGLPTVLLIASFSALLVVGAAHVRGREITRETALPFGPFLAIGIWIVWLYGPVA